MENDVDKGLSRKYCPRFGKIAVDKGFITAKQLQEAIIEQINDDLANRPHRFVGKIFFEKDWMTYVQIEIVLSELFRYKRRNKENS